MSQRIKKKLKEFINKFYQGTESLNFIKLQRESTEFVVHKDMTIRTAEKENLKTVEVDFDEFEEVFETSGRTWYCLNDYDESMFALPSGEDLAYRRDRRKIGYFHADMFFINDNAYIFKNDVEFHKAKDFLYRTIINIDPKNCFKDYNDLNKAVEEICAKEWGFRHDSNGELEILDQDKIHAFMEIRRSLDKLDIEETTETE